MKKRKIIAKLMVLSMIISNVSGINVQATDNIDVQNDNSIEYNVDTENSETFEESNVDKNIISNETVENDDLISNENEIFEVMEEVEEIDEQFLENEINEEVNYDESEVISEEVTIVSPLVSRAAAIGNVNILSSDSTTVAQAEAWARAKGATEEFVGLASLYQKYASSRGGVNWVVAYVQAAKETGYGKFGGVLDASYHNPCGLKNSSGGADEDPNAHKRFDNWDQGIIAHLDHLALYAGAAGYPKTNYVSKWQNANLDSTSTYDPRHFAYLKGRATTVNDLGGQWAPSSTYGVEIFRLYCDLTGATYLPAVSNLENPQNNATIVDGKLRVSGWALHPFGIKEVKVTLDGVTLGNATYGVTRTDVSKIYSGYFNGSQCGFDSTFELNNITNGVKTLKVQIIANDGTSTVVTRNITVQRNLQARSCLDEPTSNATVTTDSLSIKGWALNSKGIKSVEAFIDNTSYGTIKYGIKRTDVNKVYPGYPTGDNSGFEGKIDISKLSNGNKTLKVVITGNDGTVQTINRAITVKKVVLEARSWLDEPTSNATVATDSLSIKGWALNSKGIKSVEVFIDNVSYGTIKYGTRRTDVNKAYPGYSTGDNCGFEGSINISSLSNGNKTLKVVITGNDGTVQVITRNFKHGKQKTVYIDAGHDYGGDRGAVRVINGVTYDETTLNIEVAEYLRTELINKGYEVIMARRIGERPTSNNYRENLWNRINAANNANADFYISIHQNASTTTSANGVEAYYSSVKPDSLNDITYKLNTSKAVAASISSGIASALSMTNRGAKDDEFMVVKYTNMPAVLVECGFISNESDAKKISNATNQKKIASVIADSIHNALK
ncbi:N-acetylmuramoyl-L-alanine amidase [Terrisporobacter sp.]|uniref:N-acetylmuramoyl-L-alanine amidase n=1 Tax=Terrisporobacter sp. TaxID=1965305 RepID=UPI002A81C95E|nr:N-acetylmuramoyl-L-alanine amidase [Terrisporobacter sp.]MDY4735452.1 N-acetylmuramoyl-L-alanine amidase [Terrisporobacter sp.]